MGLQQAKIDCHRCGAPLELPRWEKYETKYFTQWIAECQNCHWMRTVTLRKDLKGKSDEN